MFTGIIEGQGTVKKIETKKNLLVLAIDLGPLAEKIRKGDSVAVNGVCLTATNKKGALVSFDLMRETLEKTSLRFLKADDLVNLEPALKAGSPIGGHFVTGHVDETAVIKDIAEELNWVVLRLGISRENRKYIAPKGSVTVDGISLTIGRAGKDYFEVYLIPYTLKVTTLGLKNKGDYVNIETDILAKYLFNKRKGRNQGGH
ncbi:MAG: riboflavin synthase [Candidatus Omnitrophica bacterium]|nr:riboflavin synthase [Candidatus Omnitrophota bacterium]MDE2215143.1 riboflavin synthase [Candidatus Omnitrophota bacterium]MDE2231497.1 riboflavin synthase [Candidatus Omnitrophota bacterium]